MPHWTCHYYRLETGSSFVVGSWIFSPFDSVAFMLGYSVLIGLNLLCVVYDSPRKKTLFVTAMCHLLFGVLHMYRLTHMFEFQVFGYVWSQGASIREVCIETGFATVCGAVFFRLRKDSTLMRPPTRVG